MAQELASSSVHSRSLRVCTSRSSVCRWGQAARGQPPASLLGTAPLGDTHYAQILLGMWQVT